MDRWVWISAILPLTLADNVRESYMDPQHLEPFLK
jgi:hypothetical protein